MGHTDTWAAWCGGQQDEEEPAFRAVVAAALAAVWRGGGHAKLASDISDLTVARAIAEATKEYTKLLGSMTHATRGGADCSSTVHWGSCGMAGRQPECAALRSPSSRPTRS